MRSLLWTADLCCCSVRLIHDERRRSVGGGFSSLSFHNQARQYRLNRLRRCTERNTPRQLLIHTMNIDDANDVRHTNKTQSLTYFSTIPEKINFGSGISQRGFCLTSTFLSAPVALQACLSSGLNLEERAARAWMNCRLYSIFTTQLKCSAQKREKRHW